MISVIIWEFPLKLGYHFRGPNKKDYSILGSILGSLYFGKLPYLYLFGAECTVLCIFAAGRSVSSGI